MIENQILIRQMKEEDLEQVMEIELASFSVPWSKNDFKECLARERAIYIVAQMDTKVIGYCGLLGVLDEGQIENVAVAKEYRGKNIGSKLLEHIFELGSNQGVKDYTLEVRVSNISAIRLYEKNGFVSAGLRKGYYIFPKEDALIMWKYSEN